MTKLYRLLCSVLLLASAAFGQNFVTVSAQSIYGGGTNLLPSGLILFQPVDAQLRPIGYQVGGGGQQVTWPTQCPIANGAIVQPCQLPNVNTTNPMNVCFSATIKDSSNRIILGGAQSGYTCVQSRPASVSPEPAWCTAGACNFDRFVPNLPGAIVALIPPPRTNQLGGIYAGDCPTGQVAIGYNSTGTPDCQVGGGGSGGLTDPGADGLIKRTAFNVTAPAVSADVIATLGFTPANNNLVGHLAGSETFTGIKTFSQLIQGSVSGNSGTSSALAGVPTLCPANQAAGGILANGNATGCLSLTAGLGDPGSNGLITRTAFNTTQPATGSDVVAALGFTPANASNVVSKTGNVNESINGVKTFGNTIIATAGMTGNASTASALAGTPSLCPAGQAPTGILNTGNATGCASLGLADPGNGGLVFRTTLLVTRPALPQDIDTTLGYHAANDSTVVHLTGAEDISGVKTFQSNVYLSSIQNRNGNYLVLAPAPTGVSPAGTLILDAYAGFLQIQADSGFGANLGGQLNLQSSNGPNGAASASLLVGSTGFQIGASGMTIFSAGGLKTILTGPGIVQFGNVGSTRGQATFVGSTSGSSVIGCADVTCTSFNVSGPLTIGAALGAPSGGTAVTDFSFSGSSHKAVSASGAVTAGTGCAQWDTTTGNLINTGTPCGTGSGGLVDPGANGILKRTALNTTAVAGSSDLIAALGFTPADSTATVNLTGSQTVAGIKTFSSQIVGSVSGNSGTATALAADPADCSAGSAANGVNASGTATGCIAIPVASNTVPLVNGTAAAGTGATFSRTDHVHPTDTSRAADSAVVHNTGTETVAGSKTFSSLITGSISGNAATATSATSASTAAALASLPSNCGANSAAIGILANGNATGCFSPVLVAGDIGGTAASPQVIATHLSGFTTNTISKVSSLGNLIPSNESDDGTTFSVAASGGVSLTGGGGAAGFDGLGGGTVQGVVASTIGLTAPTTVIVAYNVAFPAGPVSGTGVFKVSSNVNATNCTATATYLCGRFETLNLASTAEVGNSLLGPSNGGLGLANPTVHGLLVAEGSSPAVSLVGNVGYVLVGNGSSADPSFSATLTLGNNTTVPALGTLNLCGNTLGCATVKPPSSFTSYNFNLPSTPGTAGQPMLSGGGGSSLMTWGGLSGTTTNFATYSGTVNAGTGCAQWDTGNLTNTGTPCGAGGGGGVTAGTAGLMAGYNSTTTVASIAGIAYSDGTTAALLSLTGTSFTQPGLLVNLTSPTGNIFGVQLAGVNKLFVDSTGSVNLAGGTVKSANNLVYQSQNAAGHVEYSSGTDTNAAQGGATFRSGDMTGNGANAVDPTIVRGGNCTGTGACQGGNIVIRGGALTNASPNASATEGGTELSNTLRKGTTVTAGNLACVTADNTTGDCGTTGANPLFIGVHSAISGGSAYVQVAGTSSVNLDASSTWNAGDIVCPSGTGAALGHMNGTSACSGRRVGFAKAAGAAATVVSVVLAIN